MDHRFLARMLLAVLCGCQGIATMAIDLNRTHATHPQWLRHARFHLVWQDIESFLLCVTAIGLIWWPGSFEQQRFYLAATLVCIPMLGFLGAFICRKLYGGALSDPNGIPPLRVSMVRRSFEIDLNLAAVAAALLTLAVILIVYRG